MQVPLIQKAYQMGLYTIVLDMNLQAEGMKLAHRAIPTSTRDIDGCVRIARSLRNEEHLEIDGVITVGTDASMTVASIAAALELPGLPFNTAQKATNKILMRQALQKAGLPCMPFQPIWSLAEAREAVKKIGLPAIIKPAENMGSRGIMKITHQREIAAALRHTKSHTTTGDMILEEFLPGPELSIDALAFTTKGQHQQWITGVADRIFANSAMPYFIEMGHNMPTAMPLSIVEAAETLVKKTMRAFGISHGAAKADVKISTDTIHSGIFIGEIAARLSGGFMSAYTYPLASRVDLYRAVIRIALGMPPFTEAEAEIIAARSYPGGVAIERSICGPPGKIIKNEGTEALALEPSIEHVYMNKKAGQILPKQKSNIDKIGHIIATGKSVEEAETKLQQALAKTLTLQIDQTCGVDWQEVERNARTHFGNEICWVCRICDGLNCASGVPGMGGIGNMRSFQENIKAFQNTKIVPSYIHAHEQKIDTGLELFGHLFSHPVMGAPMTGTVTNMKLSHLSESNFAAELLKSFRLSGSIAWLGDGASPEKFESLKPAIQEAEIDGFCILICKPRANQALLQERFQEAERMRLVAVGIDIDAIAFPFVRNESVPLTAIARSLDELKALRDSTRLPFILKGILNAEDAKRALEIGADAIVVSNHGGRVLQDLPASLDMLPGIIDTVAGRIPVLMDGGIRSGEDIFKAIALGAKAVLVGRPCAIAVVGGGALANQALLNRYHTSLKQTMQVCGVKKLSEISKDFLLKINKQSQNNNQKSI